MKHLMLDFETLSTAPNAVFFSMGAVVFNLRTNEIENEFYTLVRPASALGYGLHLDARTVTWWSKQSTEGRAELTKAYAEGVELPEALNAFDLFVHETDTVESTIWGNGADFDNAILKSAYLAINREPPNGYFQNRCYRTFRAMMSSLDVRLPDLSDNENETIRHHALHDAKRQAIKLMELRALLNLTLPSEFPRMDELGARRS